MQSLVDDVAGDILLIRFFDLESYHLLKVACHNGGGETFLESPGEF